VGFDNGPILNRRDFAYWDGSLSPTGLAISEAVWTHIAMVVQANKCTLYENGVLVASDIPDCALVPNGAPLYVGGWDGPAFALDEPFYGSMDEVRIARVARSACWVEADHASQRPASNFLRVE
jgi:hypothetical protein